ncbi:hypothetical protein BGZ58_008983 [Dissophora ornata]|nr:hypothetical protein BGZ58_008983 [Dissophora ornata]
MFCPRLDSALVASIYHDMGDFKACIPILSTLAAAAAPSALEGHATLNTETNAGASSVGQTMSFPNIAKSNNNNSPNNGGEKEGSSNLNSKKKTPSPNNNPSEKNIMVWSEEVAAAESTGRPKPSGLYKQGQVTKSSFQMPSSSMDRQATAASNSTAAPATQKATYRVARNPLYMKKYGITEELSTAALTPFEDPEEQEEQEEEDDDDAPGQEVKKEDFPAIQRTQQHQQERGKSAKKNRRQKSTAKTEVFSLPSTQASGGTWMRVSSDGQISEQLTDLNISDFQYSEDWLGVNDQYYQDMDDFAIEQEEDKTTSNSNGSPHQRPQQVLMDGRNGVRVEELEFLKSCFPDREYSDEYLTQVLNDSRRDLESAVEMILSQMFLDNEQIETSSSGSGSFHSTGSQATSSSATTSSLDDSFFQGVQKSKRKSKSGGGGGSAWGTRHSKAWDGHNDALLKTIDHQDEFLIPESNEWATFEHQISILMNIFHTVPQKTIVSEYHANGAHLFKTVESLERRLKQENHHGSARGVERQTQFDISLAQLMEMFPNHSATGLKKMLVYNGGNLQDAMNAVLAADFARADQKDQPSSSKRSTVIPFQADIRHADKNGYAAAPSSSGNQLKNLPSTSNPFPGGQRLYPNTLLESSNAELYNNEDDPARCRQRAHEMLEQRNEFFRKAAKAYQESKGKGAGMGGIAAYYADEGKKMDAEGKQWHMRAARAVVQQHRLENSDPNLVDLHGLTVVEAQTVVKEAVTQWFSRATMQASRVTAKPLKIVCGVGSHSKNKVARLYPSILSLLTKDGWNCEAVNGVILVKGVSRFTPTSSSKK